MEARLTELNFNEIFDVLGPLWQDITPEVEGQIRRCMTQVTEAAQPRLVYRRLKLENGVIPWLAPGGGICANCCRTVRRRC